MCNVCYWSMGGRLLTKGGWMACASGQPWMVTPLGDTCVGVHDNFNTVWKPVDLKRMCKTPQEAVEYALMRKLEKEKLEKEKLEKGKAMLEKEKLEKERAEEERLAEESTEVVDLTEDNCDGHNLGDTVIVRRFTRDETSGLVSYGKWYRGVVRNRDVWDDVRGIKWVPSFSFFSLGLLCSSPSPLPPLAPALRPAASATWRSALGGHQMRATGVAAAGCISSRTSWCVAA